MECHGCEVDVPIQSSAAPESRSHGDPCQGSSSTSPSSVLPRRTTASSCAAHWSTVSSRTRQPAVIAVVAPAGYGKTTVLAQWAARQPRLVWLSVDDRDNDPTVLLTHLATAADRVEQIDPDVLWSVASAGGHGQRRTPGRVIKAMSAPVAIVLDHAEALTNRICHDLVAELALRLPPGSQLAIGSRREVPVPVSLLRTRGGIAEIGIGDLAMTGAEARSLLAGAGLEAAAHIVDELRID